MDDIDIASDTDDDTTYMSAGNIDEAIDSLGQIGNTLFKQFKDNLFTRNADMCHLLVNSSNINIRRFKIEKLHESCLGKIYSDKSSFEWALGKRWLCLNTPSKLSGTCNKDA